MHLIVKHEDNEMVEKKKSAIASQKKSNLFEDILNTDFTEFTKLKKDKAATGQPDASLGDSLSDHNMILDINPKQATNWQFHDRHDIDMGDLEALAQDMKLNGQIEPCIARKMLTPSAEGHLYEVIAGERRWRAATMANIRLNVLVRELSDEKAAIIQAAENLNRQNLSDFSIGMSYAKLIETGTIKQVDLIEKLGFSKVQINRFMSFSQVDSRIWDAVANPSKISARTATEIRALSNKGEAYISAIIALADKIREGKIGANNLKKAVDHIIKPPSDTTKPQKITVKSNAGKALFDCKFDATKHSFSFSIPKTLQTKVDATALVNKLVHLIEEEISVS